MSNRLRASHDARSGIDDDAAVESASTAASAMTSAAVTAGAPAELFDTVKNRLPMPSVTPALSVTVQGDRVKAVCEGEGVEHPESDRSVGIGVSGEERLDIGSGVVVCHRADRDAVDEDLNRRAVDGNHFWLRGQRPPEVDEQSRNGLTLAGCVDGSERLGRRRVRTVIVFVPSSVTCPSTLSA